VRAAKGHDIDARELNYKSGDSYLHATQGRSNQTLVPIDSTGRTYALPAHALPSARGQGEPLSSQLNPPPGANFVGLMLDDLSSHYVLASDSGYGLVVKLEDMLTKNKKGKALEDYENNSIAVVTTGGYLLVYDAQELPLLAKGKGVKLINIPAKLLKNREEIIASVVAFRPEQAFDLDHYRGERGLRGKKLPRGFQQVNELVAE